MERGFFIKSLLKSPINRRGDCVTIQTCLKKRGISGFIVNIIAVEKKGDEKMRFITEEKVLSMISVKKQKGEIIIRSEIKDKHSLENLPYKPSDEIHLNFPVYEQIEFNLRNGRTYIRIVTQDDRLFYTLDITNRPRLISECNISKWFYGYESLRKRIKETFETMTKSVVPFDVGSHNLENLVFFTRFTGYDTEFYDAIPYNKETLELDRSFKNTHKLHSREAAVIYLRSFSFSECKSIRKQVFKKSGLLFYLPECEELYNAIGDVNIFRNLMDNRYVFDILILLHQHPVSIDFFRDYCRIKGADSFLRKIGSHKYTWCEFRYYIINYCSMSSYSKTIEQKKWKYKSHRDYINEFCPTNYSLPMTTKSSENLECIVYGFTFRLLKNTYECTKAGQELNNCLANWESYNSNIVVVSKRGKTVAAIEIDEDRIIQAHTYRNGDIREVEELPEAIRIWKEKSGIHYQCPYEL